MSAPPVFVPQHSHPPAPARPLPAAIYVPPAPPPPILAMITGAAGILVALGFAGLSVVFLLDDRATTGVMATMMLGLLTTVLTVYLGGRTATGKLGSMIALAPLGLLLWLATLAMLRPSATDDRMLFSIVHEHRDILASLGNGALGLGVLAPIAAIVTVVRRSR